VRQRSILIGLGLLIAAGVGIGLAVRSSQNMPGMGGPAKTGDQTVQATNSVTIQGFAYAPANITVKKGTTVTWTNQDQVDHNVVSDDNQPAGGPPTDNPLLNKGQSYQFTFNTAGTFHYHCTPHPYMQAVVIVTE